MKNKERKIIVEEKFKIPQIDAKYEGLKKTKPGFERTIAASPYFGSKVKDKLLIPDNKGTVDVDKAYDAFRPKGSKHISDEELIKKHGTRFYDFKILNENKREEVLGVKYEEEKVEEEVVEETDDLSFRKVEPTESHIYYKENEEIKRPNISLNNVEESKVIIPKVENAVKEEKPEIKLNLGFDISDLEEEKPAVKERINYDYELPPLNLFKHSENSSDEVPDWIIEKKEIINKLLQDFDVDGEVVSYVKGPAFTRYEIMLQSGVKVNKVSNLYDNFQMELGAKSIRILAPIPGKKTVGIEVPNDKTETVYFGDMIDESFVNDGRPLRVALGKNIDGETIYKAIDDMPHLLVAGATKSGKSVCMNTILISLLVKNRPEDLKLILVDPKKVEMSFYEEIPHLVTPVISEPEMASGALKWAVDEMEKRYEMLARAHVKNIEDYNRKALKFTELKHMSYIVIVIDELADLMMTCSSDVEDSIKRITQKARAAGIHLIVATQRPTVQIVSGNIKANIPCRIGFKVASFVDSNTILDEGGAETLLGRGDMLIKDNDLPERVQGAFISDDEINDVCDFIRNESRPQYLFTHADLKQQIAETPTYKDNLNQESEGTIYEVAKYCIMEGQASINSIQNSFGFGFNRAQRIVQILEQRQILGPKTGSTKGREVLVTLAELDRMFGRSSNEENL